MNYFFSKTILCCLLATIFQMHLVAQPQLTQLFGKWKLEKLNYSGTSNQEKIQFSKDASGTVVSFEPTGKFTTYKPFKDSLKISATGIYLLSDDCRYLYQGKNESEIIKLTETELELRINDEILMFFSKIQ